ncbi:MAG: terpene cyclase/mutase family protein [Planctomycetes bacterium]|nr:terpene cyclase/mutase family protein [Planctomycetota bacterium]
MLVRGRAARGLLLRNGAPSDGVRGGLLCTLCVALASAARALPEGERPSEQPRGAPKVDGRRSTPLDGQDTDAVRNARDDARTRSFVRGLEFLAGAQTAHQDGSFPAAGGRQHAPVALAGLGALAFMAEGSTPERGRFGKNVSAAVDYLLSKADSSASGTRGYIAVSLDDEWGMHAHGYALLALCNAYTLSPLRERGQRIAELLPDAVRVIEASQTSEGGWFYKPVAGFEHENSVTVVQLQALRAARNCGITVQSTVIARAIDYIRRCQSENGSFRYALEPASKTSLALTAAGLATLQNAGHYTGPEVDRAVHELWVELVERERGTLAVERNFPHYERLYVALALWTHADQRLFQQWFATECKAVVEDQRADGSWSDEQFGACYATSMNCLFLSIDDALLPLFER